MSFQCSLQHSVLLSCYQLIGHYLCRISVTKTKITVLLFGWYRGTVNVVSCSDYRPRMTLSGKKFRYCCVLLLIRFTLIVALEDLNANPRDFVDNCCNYVITMIVN